MNSIKMLELGREILDASSTLPNILVFKEWDNDASPDDLGLAISLAYEYLRSEEYLSNASLTGISKRNSRRLF